MALSTTSNINPAYPESPNATTLSVQQQFATYRTEYAALAGALNTSGAQGPQGAAGAQGAQGVQGTAGAQGPQGAAGANGIGTQGPQGPQGAAGAGGGAVVVYYGGAPPASPVHGQLWMNDGSVTGTWVLSFWDSDEGEWWGVL